MSRFEREVLPLVNLILANDSQLQWTRVNSPRCEILAQKKLLMTKLETFSNLLQKEELNASQMHYFSKKKSALDRELIDTPEPLLEEDDYFNRPVHLHNVLTHEQLDEQISEYFQVAREVEEEEQLDPHFGFVYLE
jgi:hypothetical protein